MRSRPDLMDLLGLTGRWRIRRDEEGLPVILGRRGSVSAQDLETLCVHVGDPSASEDPRRRGRARLVLPRMLRELPPGWRRHQVGDEEANLLAPLSDLDRACELVRGYRRRYLSDDQRARLVAAGRPFTSRPHEANEGDSGP